MEGKTIFVGAKAGAFFFLLHDSAVRAWSSGKTRILTRYGRDSKKVNLKKETDMADFNAAKGEYDVLVRKFGRELDIVEDREYASYIFETPNGLYRTFQHPVVGGMDGFADISDFSTGYFTEIYA